METADLSQLLTRHRSRLVGYFERNGRSIRQHESPEDLAQGVALHALANEGYFHYQGERQFIAWMLKVARQHLSRRLVHWGAAKRDAGPMMRLTFGIETQGGGSRGAVRMPAAEGPGPATHASNLEELAIAARAVDGLPPRDREIVRMMTRDVSSSEIAENLGISPEAATKARQRAIERFRKIYTILERQQSRPDTSV
ncbi:MAG: sigma-70 family RNA polymerase sigma factor [Planctomycetota bacterium]